MDMHQLTSVNNDSDTVTKTYRFEDLNRTNTGFFSTIAIANQIMKIIETEEGNRCVM